MKKMTGAEVLADMLAGYGVTHVFMVPAVLRRTFAEMERRTEHPADPRPRREGRRLHGRRLRARLGAAGRVHGAGGRRAQSRGGPARRVPRALAGHRLHRRARAAHQVPAGVPGSRRRPVVRAGDQVQRHGRRVSSAFPTWCARRSASRSRARPGRCISSSAATKARSTQEEAEMEPLVEPQFARVPPFRPEPERAHVLAALAALAVGRASGDRRRRRRPRVGRGPRARGARREARHAGGDLAQRQGRHPRHPSARRRRRRQLLAREREPRCCGRRPRLLRRHHGRRHDHALLGRAEDRASMPSRSTSTPRRSAATIRSRPAVLGDVKTALARMLEHADPSTAARRHAWLETTRGICREWYEKYGPLLGSDAVPIRPERICAELTKHVPDDAIVVVDTGHAGMWMGGMYDLRSPRQSYIRSAGHLGWAFPAGLGAKVRRARSPGGDVHRRRRASGTTSARSRPPCGGRSTRSPSSTTTRRQPVEARLRPRLRRQQTEQARELWTFNQRQLRHASPRRSARSASASSGPATSRPPCSGRSRPAGRS